MESAIVSRVRDLVHEFDPAAEVILYGSHARGEATPESDWDILIITSGVISWDKEQQLRSVIYRYEVASDTVLSVVIHSQKEWSDPLFQLTPFCKNVSRDGIRIWQNLYDIRQTSDYEDLYIIDSEKVISLMPKVKGFLAEIEKQFNDKQNWNAPADLSDAIMSSEVIDDFLPAPEQLLKKEENPFITVWTADKGRNIPSVWNIIFMSSTEPGVSTPCYGGCLTLAIPVQTFFGIKLMFHKNVYWIKFCFSCGISVQQRNEPAAIIFT